MKIKYLTRFLMSGMMVGMAQAATTVWNPAANGILPPDAGNWGQAANWTNGVPTSNPDTAAPNKAVFNVAGAAEARVTDAQEVRNLVQGDNGPGGVIRVTDGGTLTLGDLWTGIGYNNTARLIIESGATVATVHATNNAHMWIGALTGATGVIDVTGTLTIAGNIGLGTINANTAGGGAGILNVLAGGTVNLDRWSAWNPDGNSGAGAGSIHGGSFINIFGGTVTIKGNRVSQVDAYVALGRIIGGGPIERSYNSGTNLTTITAIPEPGSWALLGLAGLGLLARRRRRPAG